MTFRWKRRGVLCNGILVHNCDELYAWMREAWEQLQFAVRLELGDGDFPRIIVTTTPKGSKLVREVRPTRRPR